MACGNEYSFWVLKMTLASGVILQACMGADGVGTVVLGNYSTTQSGGSTATPYAGTNLFWWPIADTVISAIEMYNTD